MGGALLAFSACKDSSGDMQTVALISGVPAKYALSATVDATDNNIKVGEKAIIDSNGGTDTENSEGVITASDAAHKTSYTGYELEQQHCGKRAFKEFSSGFNNNAGFRTNVVLDLKNGKWTNVDTGRKATAGILFDFNKYGSSTQTYDFFFLAFQPVIGSDNVPTSVICYFERYVGVKKYNDGVYSRHKAASALGSSYIQSSSSLDNTDWDLTYKDASNNPIPYTADQGKSKAKTLEKDTDYIWDAANQLIIIGVDAKQQPSKGMYTVRVGKITYDLNGVAQPFSTTVFSQAWKTTFTPGHKIGVGGETSSANSFGNAYTNWKHVDSNDKDTNLLGGVMAYAFAPYGTKPVILFLTCSTGANKDAAAQEGGQYDYIGDWNISNDIEVSEDGKSTVIYEEGNVVHEYFYY